ncbi:MAG: DNA polymerase I [Clostridiales bacterium]|nr:DNA polymerase I [Clostridiales bacterium]
MKKLLALDANSLLNRAFYAIRPLTTRAGESTNAIFGFISSYLKLLADEQPDAVLACFDLHAPTFRHMEFSDYKAGRRPTPPELISQFDLLREILDALGVPRAEVAGFEADDLIGTISKRCEQDPDWTCVIVTGDRDSFQLIDDTTSVLYITTRNHQSVTIPYTPEKIMEEYGITPPQMIEVKSLMGDASDNIPGVPGIGEKTALMLIQKFGTMRGVYDNIDDPSIKKGVREKLLAGRESAEMSRVLAEIERDAPLDFTPDDALLRGIDKPRLLTLFERLELRRFIVQLRLRDGVTVPASAQTAAAEDTVPAQTVPVESSADAPMVFLNMGALDAVGVLRNGDFTLLLQHEAGFRDAVTRLLDPSVPKLTHDAKPIYLAAMELDIPCGGFVEDTAVAAYLLDPGADVTLDAVAGRFLGISAPAPDLNVLLSPFRPADAVNTFEQQSRAVLSLYEVLPEKLRTLGMDTLYRALELPLTRVLAGMQHAGVLVDAEQLHIYSEKLGARIRELEALVYEQAGETFNLNSPKQLGELLFDRMGLRGGRKTKTGWSTDIDILEALKNDHPIIPYIIEFRQLTKLRGTYADGLPRFISPKDGRIHSNLQQLVTATGRLSSTDPNLQNIPVRKALGAELRRMFVAPEGWVLVDADYSQIELRLLAHIAEDTAMLEAFRKGFDIHRATAAVVAGISPEDVTPQQRSAAKAVNFGIVYGISDYSLAGDLGITRAEARDYIARYLDRYAGVRDYMERVKKEAYENGYVTTLFGRRRELPELKSSNRNTRMFGERVALNTPIQGTAADIIKRAMVNVADRLKREGLRARLVLQVHDELIVETPREETETVKKLLTEEMEGAVSLSVQLKVDASMGENWYDAKG